MTAPGDEFVWIGTVSGAWGDAANWQDVTAGTKPAAAPPGPADDVTFSSYTQSVTVTGSGSAAAIGFGEQAAITGTLQAGVVEVQSYFAQNVTLAVAAGGTISAVSFAIAASNGQDNVAAVTGRGALLEVSGTLTDTGALQADGGGEIKTGSLLINDVYGQTLAVDSLSSVEIGTLGGAAAGALTVDDNAVFTILPGSASYYTWDVIAASVIDNGVIEGAAPLMMIDGGLSGTGLVSLATGAGLDVSGAVSGSLSFDLAAGATLTLGQVGDGATINLDGAADVLIFQSVIGSSILQDATYSQDTLGPQAVIAGFDSSDVILLDATADAASFVTGTGSLGGNLIITEAGTAIATLALQGDYSGDKFFVVPASNGAAQSEIAMLPPPAGTLSAGTESGSQFLWTGPLNGNWNDAANWEDLTAPAGPATIAPGALDSVTIDNLTQFEQVLGGSGAAASLSLNGDHLFAGSFAIGTIFMGDDVYEALGVAAGGTLIVNALLDYDTVLAVSGAGALLRVNSGLDFAGPLIEAAQGGVIQLGSLLVSAAELTVDSESSIEIGTLGGAPAGYITVDDGATLAADTNLTLDGPVIDNGLITAGSNMDFNGNVLGGTGTIAVQSGAAVSLGSSIGGDIAFQIGTGAGLNLGLAGAGDSITLAGHDTLALTQLNTLTPQGDYQQTSLSVDAAISGFNVTDVISVNYQTIDSATYVAGSVAGTGSLVLSDAGSVVTTLTLDGDYTGDQFLALPGEYDYGPATDILLVTPSSGGTISPGTGNGDLFSWTGAINNDWNNPGNWIDYTTFAAPATIAPGGTDQVRLDGIVEGTGDAAAASMDAVLAGNFNIGTVTVNQNGAAGIFAGGTLTAGTLINDGEVDVAGSLSRLLVTGTLIGDGTVLQASGGGQIQAAALIIEGFEYTTISADTLSSIEIGTLGGAETGAVSVDANATLNVTGNYTQLTINSPVDDNGVILASDSAALDFAGSLWGNGVVSITTGASVTSAGSVGGQVQFLLGAGAELDIEQAGSNAGITLGGANDTLAISAPGFSPYGYPAFAPSFDMQAVITGFSSADLIIVNGAADSAAYEAGTTSGTGALILSRGGTVTGTLTLDGNYSGDAFAAIQTGNDSLEIAAYATGSSSLSAGTGTGDSFLWTNTFAGNWNDAANWEDTSLGTNPAALAPGAKDSVTFASGTASYSIIGGTGIAAAASFSGDNAVTGTLTLGTLDIVDGSISNIVSSNNPYPILDISGGGHVTAGNVSMGSIATLRVAGPGSWLSTASTLELANTDSGLDAAAGGKLQLGGLTMSGGGDYLAVDASSSMEIGTRGNAAIGALTVDDGVTLLAANAGPDHQEDGITGAVVDDGTIITGVGLELHGALSGTGTVIVQSGAYLAGYSSITGSILLQLGSDASAGFTEAGAGVGIVLGGQNDSLVIDNRNPDIGYIYGYGPPNSFTMLGTVAGFNSSDDIEISDTVTGVTYQAGTASGTGALILTYGTQLVGTIALAGTFTNPNFLAVPDVGFDGAYSEIVLLPGSVSSADGIVTVTPLAGQTLTLDPLDADGNFATYGIIPNLVIDGPGTAAVASDFNAATIIVAGGGVLQLDGGYLMTDPITVNANGDITGYGVLNGSVDNAGSITATGGVLWSNGSIGGTGDIFIDAGAGLTAGGGLGSGQSVTFNGSGGTLTLFGSFGGSIAGFAPGDTIMLQNISSASGFYVSGTGLEMSGTSGITLDIAGSLVTGDFSINADGTSTTITAGSAPCYCAGTRIRTAAGEVPVEDLRIGDIVITRGGAARPIKWLGRRAYDGKFIAGQHLKLPVCISRNAIAENIPARDLWVSPGHAIFVEGLLVPAWRLINGVSITQAAQVAQVAYYHIELETHDIIIAENCPAESFFDADCRGQFQNAEDYARLYGNAAPAEGLARTESGFALDRLQRRLARRAGLPARQAVNAGPLRGFLDLAGPQVVAGWAQWQDAPETPMRLDIYAAGRRVARVLANQYRADLRDIGFGSGCHGFTWSVPRGMAGPFNAVCSRTGTALPPSRPVPLCATGL